MLKLMKRVFRATQFGLWSQPKSMPCGPALFGHPLDGTYQMIARGAYGDFTINSLKAAPQNCIFLDVGANIGYFTVAMAKHFLGRIYCFEPSIRTFGYLQRNLMHNSVDNAVAICAAITDGDQVSANLSKKRFHSGAASLVRSFGTQSDRVTLFGPNLIKAILPEAGVFAVKIDVEGAELGVVNALHQAGILGRTERVIIEMSLGTNNPKDLNEIRKILNDTGLTMKARTGSDQFGDELFVRN